MNYQNKDQFFDTIKKAKSMCEQYVEEYLFTGKNTAGGIFNLVNNYGWQNKTNSEVNAKIEHTVPPEKQEQINKALEDLS
jgi:hypothetical protein